MGPCQRAFLLINALVMHIRWCQHDQSPTHPSKNSQRNLRMLNETTRYARLIRYVVFENQQHYSIHHSLATSPRHFIKKVKAIARATDDLITEADTVITSPLPRQFTLRGGLLQTLDLDGQPSAPPPAKGEKMSKAQSLEATESTAILARDLDAGVFAPLNKWLEDQAEARRKFKATEGVWEEGVVGWLLGDG